MEEDGNCMRVAVLRKDGVRFTVAADADGAVTTLDELITALRRDTAEPAGHGAAVAPVCT